MKVFGFEDRGKERIYIVSNVVGSMYDKASVDRVKIFDAKSSIFFALADVVLGPKSNWGSGVVLLDTSPPESSDDSYNSFNKSLRE